MGGMGLVVMVEKALVGRALVETALVGTALVGTALVEKALAEKALVEWMEGMALEVCKEGMALVALVELVE